MSTPRPLKADYLTIWGVLLTGSRIDRVLGCHAADLAAVEAIVTRAGTSFAKGMHILSRERRYGMFAIYAFCREVDDIADGDTKVENPVEELEAWRARVAHIFQNETQNALDRVLAAAIQEFDLQQKDFDAVIDGMLMDVPDPIIAPDEAALDLYCDRVASAVGRLSVRVFGEASEEADQVAHHLGRALQMTNILRDIKEDADRGRLYLPKELLTRFKVPADPQEALYAPGLDGLARVLAKRTHDHYRLAWAAMKKCGKKPMRPAAMMAASYQPILHALEKRGWTQPEKPVRVNKALRLARSLIIGFR